MYRIFSGPACPCFFWRPVLHLCGVYPRTKVQVRTLESRRGLVRFRGLGVFDLEGKGSGVC